MRETNKPPCRFVSSFGLRRRTCFLIIQASADGFTAIRIGLRSRFVDRSATTGLHAG